MTSLSQGFNSDNGSKTPVWYCHTGAQFRDERYCDELVKSISHTGWYSDEECSEKVRGIVGRLTHGRFIAGYEWSSNGERVYFGDVFDDVDDAARRADSHAEWYAETCREHDANFQAAQRLETKIEQAFARLRECLTLRNNPCFDYARDEIAELIASIRSNRDDLETNYAGVL